MIRLIRTDSQHPDFIELVTRLDRYLAVTDGDEHAFYHQYNSIAPLKNVVLAFYGDSPASCGAIKEFAPGVMEVKRMYTLPEYRGKGLASAVLGELESWARELSYRSCILETGKKQEEAIRLYPKNGYRLIPNYGQYSGVENSLCFEKII